MMPTLRSSRWLVLLPLAALALGLGGCGKKMAEKAQEKIIENALEKEAAKSGQKADVKVDLSKGEMTIDSKGEGGESYKMSSKDNTTSVTKADGSQVVVGDSVAIPASFPKDVPLYPGMKPTMAAAEPAQESFSLSATTPDSLQKVAGFYKEKVKENGWSEETPAIPDTDEMSMLMYTKDQRSLQVMVMKAGDGTGIQIVIGKK